MPTAPSEVVAPTFLGIPAAVQRTGISRSSIYELIKCGRLRPVHFGRRVLLPVAEIERLEAELVEQVGG